MQPERREPDPVGARGARLFAALALVAGGAVAAAGPARAAGSAAGRPRRERHLERVERERLRRFPGVRLQGLVHAGRR